MTDMPPETRQVFELLNASGIHPAMLEEQLQGFSASVKDDMVAHLAQTSEPLSGRVVARLPSILTETNQNDMQRIFVAGLQSSDSDARVFSLHGLNTLKYPQLTQFALNALEDDSDQVLVAAATILLSNAEQNPDIRARLQQVYQARRSDHQFYGITSLLQAHHIDNPEG